MAYKKAHFKTALGQREIVLDCKVSEKLEVGAICTLTGDTLAGSETATSDAYIVAQSDMTMEYGHVPVENQDHRYNPEVAASTSLKKVAVFKIIDVADVIVRN